MNRRVSTGVRSAGIAALCIVVGLPRLGAADSSGKAAKEAAAVERVIRNAAQALSDFPRTLDAEALLSNYATGFTGIENGQETSLQDQRNLLADLRDQLAAGTQIVVSFRAGNIRVRISEKMAVATYDYSFRMGIAGEALDEEEGKCTSILEKLGARWLFRHEHCSSACPPCADDEDEEDPDSTAPERT